MVLSDVDIQRALEEGKFKLDPRPEPNSFSTSSVDLHLGDEFLTWDYEGAKRILDSMGHGEPFIDIENFNFSSLAREFTKPFEKEPDGSVVLKPKEFILSKTNEKVGNPDPGCCLAARVEGRSSLARLGLQIHMTAPTIHAGFFGKIALEMFNAGPFPLKLKPGIPICQLIVEQVSSPPQGSLKGSQFQGQDSAKGNR